MTHIAVALVEGRIITRYLLNVKSRDSVFKILPDISGKQFQIPPIYTVSQYDEFEGQYQKQVYQSKEKQKYFM